jgi:hypothetical protein
LLLKNELFVMRGHIRHKRSKYEKRKIWFWIILGLLALLIIFLAFFLNKKTIENKLIRVAVCGCVNQRAVYTMREGSDMAMLIRQAKGFTINADAIHVNLDKIVKNDSVYHIPCLGATNDSKRSEFISQINRTIKLSYRDLSKEVVAAAQQNEIKCYTILYIGIPAVYVLISYYPEFHRINFVHIPHSAMFLNTEYRLIDLFFTLDIYPTMRILEHTLQQKIDYYLIQDRFNFIDLIDLLGGVNINLDKPYADEYNLKPGKNNLDGYYAWEYIRFLDWRNVKMTVKSEKKKDLVRQDNFEMDPRTMEMTYEMRNQRQRYVLEGMRRSFQNLSTADQLYVIENFKNVFRTDMKADFLNMLYKDILSTPSFSYGNVPGYYSVEGSKLFFYPDLPSFEMIRKREIRTYLEKRKDKNQVVY